VLAPADLARLGITSPRAVALLEALAAGGDIELVVDAAAQSANAELALSAFERLAERRPDAWRSLREDPPALLRAAGLAGTGEALGEALAALPDATGVLFGELDAWDASVVRARAAAALDDAREPAAAAAALAACQRAALLRVAARDVCGVAATPAVTAELADLAQGVLAAAFDTVAAEATASVAVIAMGKLGGRELNYVSDVDVIFVHDGDRADALRVCERFLRLFTQVTPYGRAYEVDANLRPEGKDGPLSRTLESFQAYYERWAKPWEFQALLKARPVAGDPELGQRFLTLSAPFVWPDRLDASAVEEIQRLKGVVEASGEVRRAGARQVKLAPGGLRDIEFAVQLLQLVHGRHDASVRSPNTLDALAALAAGGYVGEDDAQLFTDAYAFLRTVEHRLQLARLRRTHTLPDDDAQRERLARTVGYRPDAAASALERFDSDLRSVQALVRQVHTKLFYRPLLARFAEVGADGLLPTNEGQLAPEAARERLAALGFADPQGALAHLDALASGLTRRAQLFRTLLPAVLPTLAAAPDPDGGLAGLRALAERLETSTSFLRTLRDNPPVGDLLAQVLGASRLVGEWLQRQPEVVARLSDLAALEETLAPGDYRRLADGLVRRGTEEAESADALRRLRRRELARTAVRDLSGRASVVDVATELTGQAEACLHAAVALTVPAALRFAVIGMGKLGGGELGYGSDLDLLLVFAPNDARRDALQAAERFLAVLSGITREGRAFDVDVGLRPEGKDGPLARTVESYQTYYARWGEPWELQALTQARFVAGDRALADDFGAAVAPIVYPSVAPADRLAEVRWMKARVERERAGTRTQPLVRRRRSLTASVRTDERVDVKLGPGGLSDVEWTVQLLQLRHGGTHPALRVPGARAALDALRGEGLIGEDDAAWLRNGLDLLARVRNCAHLAGFRDSARLPPGARDQERLARMLGYPEQGRQALLEDLGRVMRRVRKVHERCFYDA
jgi:glutamate-ammonia-ligase adenylyltransferase